MRNTAHGVIFMSEKQMPEIRDPKLPTIRAGQSGSEMEVRRRGAPLPKDLADSITRQQL